MPAAIAASFVDSVEHSLAAGGGKAAARRQERQVDWSHPVAVATGMKLASLRD